MSLDLQIWSTQQVDFSRDLQETEHVASDRRITAIDELSFISTGNWLSNADAFAETGSPPRNIGQFKPEAGSPDTGREYPKSWPFDPPRSER